MDLISIDSKEGLSFYVNVRDHQLISDMPQQEGGIDEGVRPTEMLVSALGACLAISIARYCQTIHCSTQGLGLYLTYQLEDQPKRIASIVIDVELPEDFPRDRNSVVHHLVKTCPVYNTLRSQPEIDIEISN